MAGSKCTREKELHHRNCHKQIIFSWCENGKMTIVDAQDSLETVFQTVTRTSRSARTFSKTRPSSLIVNVCFKFCCSCFFASRGTSELQDWTVIVRLVFRPQRDASLSKNPHKFIKVWFKHWRRKVTKKKHQQEAVKSSSDDVIDMFFRNLTGNSRSVVFPKGTGLSDRWVIPVFNSSVSCSIPKKIRCSYKNYIKISGIKKINSANNTRHSVCPLFSRPPLPFF